MESIKLNNVIKRFDEHLAVDSVSMEIRPGKIFGLIGPNGAGKTTTIRMMMNIMLPDEGEIEILGQKSVETLKNRIGYLPEERGLYKKMKVLKLLTFMGELKGMKTAEAIKESKFWLEKIGLSQWAEHKVEDLSKGMQQKIQFISTILHDPDVIILDEPFSGLDPVNQEVLLELLNSFRSDNKIIIFSTHIMEQAEKLCDEICLINKGKVVLNGALNEVMQTYGAKRVVVDLANRTDLQLESLPYIEKVTGFGNHYEIQLTDMKHSRELLQYLVGLTDIEVRKYQTSETTLHEIFVDLVGGTNHE